MLKGENRADSKDIASIGRGAVIRTPHILFSYSPTSGVSRVAVSVAKKVAKRAVDRNRLKRQCRSALRAALPTLDNRPIIGIARIIDSRVSYKELESEIEDIFKHKIEQ